MSIPTWETPYWSQPPSNSHEWNLLEIKQGNLLSSFSLNKLASERSGCVTFGRMDDSSLVDVVTAHESCSRLHARLAFDSSGNLWLRDLQSNNGTFVNNIRLPPEACGKVEAPKGSKADGARGSRGVMVYPGDVFKFGASTRIYCLEGPQEFDKEQRNQQQTVKQSDEHSEENHPEDRPPAECSWGMASEDDQPENETARVADPNLPSIEAFFSPSSNYTIPSSLQQLHKTYQTKQYKLHAIQTETSRIVQKEDRGIELTDGQMKQIEKNRERIDSLEKDLDDLTIQIEEGIYSIVHGKQINLRKRKNAQSTKYDDDVDDFYDKTAQQEKKQRASNDEAESEQSLIQKWTRLCESHKIQCKAVSRAQQNKQKIQQEISNMDDEEETFFLQNDLTLANEALDKASIALEGIAKELTETEYLLQIVNSELSWSREDSWIGLEVDKKKDDIECQATSLIESSRAAVNEESIIMPPPMQVVPASKNTSMDEETSIPIHQQLNIHEESSDLASSMTPPTKTTNDPRVALGPSMPPPSAMTTRPCSNNMPKSSSKRLITASKPSSTLGTLAVLQQATNAQKKANVSEHEAKGQSSSITSSFDHRKDEWSAPKGQDGSGRTALNDKFKGRY